MLSPRSPSNRLCKWTRCANNWQQGTNPLKGCNLHLGLQIKNLFHLHTRMKSPETWQAQKALHHLPSFNGHHQLPRSQSQGIMLIFCPALPTESSMSRQLLLQNVSWSIHLSSLNPQFKLPSSFTGYRLSPNWSQCSAPSLSPWPTEYS